MEKTSVYLALFAIFIGLAMGQTASCNSTSCAAYATCTNGTCTCSSGFEGDGINNCTNIDECQRGTHNCSANASCIDFTGYFGCMCNSGYAGDGINCTIVGMPSCGTCSPYANCTNNLSCICNPGFTGNGTVCEDINECVAYGYNPCGLNRTCINRLANYSCTCNGGFVIVTKSNKLLTCEPIPVSPFCTCSPSAYCEANTSTCICYSGYTGNGSFCEAVTPCGTCSPYEYCNISSLMCMCNPGFIRNGTVCEDINECTVYGNPCGPNGTCINLMGNYSCNCDSDFEVVNRGGVITCGFDTYRFPASEIASDPVCNPENSRETRNEINNEIRGLIRNYQAMQNNSTSDSVT